MYKVQMDHDGDGFFVTTVIVCGSWIAKGLSRGGHTTLKVLSPVVCGETEEYHEDVPVLVDYIWTLVLANAKEELFRNFE